MNSDLQFVRLVPMIPEIKDTWVCDKWFKSYGNVSKHAHYSATIWPIMAKLWDALVLLATTLPQSFSSLSLMVWSA